MPDARKKTLYDEPLEATNINLTPSQKEHARKVGRQIREETGELGPGIREIIRQHMAEE